MSLTKTLGIGAAAALLSGIAIAAILDLEVTNDPNNIVAAHIAGDWMLEKAITRQLNPDADTSKMIAVNITPDNSVLKRLTKHSEEYAKLQIYSAGLVKFGRNEEHPYLLVNRNGNMHLVWFVPASGDAADPVAETKSKTVFLAVGKNKRQDMLFLGGTAARDAAAAYTRSASN
jgi:hypothetical protein